MLTNSIYHSNSISTVCPNPLFTLPELSSSYSQTSYSQPKKITQVPPGQFSFEESVRELIGGANLRIETSEIGHNAIPILYNDDTNEIIAVFKEYTSMWTTPNWGDLAAYRLDHDSFANVPLAFRLTSLPKNAPQRFLSGVFVKWIPSSRMVSSTERVCLVSEQSEAISILDMRLGNKDRHCGNILVGTDGKLIPIDHDATFSLYKPYPGASSRNFPLSERAIKYISKLDINQDIKILRECGVQENEVPNYVIRTIFLKIAADVSRHTPITLGAIEDTIESTKLPSGSLGVFFDQWIYANPLRSILNQHNEPYCEGNLKQDFKEIFNSYLSSAAQSRINAFFASKLQDFYCS